MPTPFQLTAVAASALIASMVNSVAGGGTFLTFPTLTGVANLPEKIANMTSTVGLWPGSASSVAAAWNDIKKLPRAMLAAYATLSLLGGAAGSLLLTHTKQSTFIHVIPWLLAFATLLFAFSKPIARWANRQHGHRTLKWTLLVGLIQLLVALYGGYFGAGIGVLMLAGLSFAGLDDIHQTNALKVLLATLINGVAAAIFLFDHIDWAFAASMAAASIAGGFLGMKAARQIKPHHLRLIILAIGTALTAVYFWKSAHAP